jgi:nicotinamide-nucleotide amidase
METRTYALAEQLGAILLKRKLHCAVAESCTGGALAAAITEVPGSSQWFDRGFVTYTNPSKQELLAVPSQVITTHGAVSEETVRYMAEGVLAHSDAFVSVGISGIAGPGGGSVDKPVGTVWIAWAGDYQPTHAECFLFKGNRAAIREQAVEAALQGLLKRCEKDSSPVSVETYFFALWPDKQLAKNLYERVQEVLGPQDKPIPCKNLHLTLAYLGQIPSSLLKAAENAAAKIKIPPFQLNINHADYWEKIRLRWLGLENSPKALQDLVFSLNSNLLTEGFKPDRHSFVPHITVARQCIQHYKVKTIEPLIWPLNDFCLVRSVKCKGQSNYEIIRRWSLSA